MKQYFRYRATSLKRRINLGFINRRFILGLRYSSDEVASREDEDEALQNVVFDNFLKFCAAFLSTRAVTINEKKRNLS